MSAADRMDLAQTLKMLGRLNPGCNEYLWQRYVFGLDYPEMAIPQQTTPASILMPQADIGSSAW